MIKKIIIGIISIAGILTLFSLLQFKNSIEDLREQNQVLRDSLEVVKIDFKVQQVISNKLKEELNELEEKLKAQEDAHNSR
ncbi:MAG: hypothetical protein ABJP45_03440 [Cyclobacteriaceae bacterium]